MGDPKKTKKKYFTPRHPWIKENIESERELVREYAFKRKKEIYKLNSILKTFKDQAKKLIAAKTSQAEKEKQQLIQRLQRLGLIPAGAALDDILGLTTQNIMDRRLQNLVFKKGFARTQAQARQFIVHQQIVVNNKKITSPNHLVTQAEEDTIAFYPQSKLANPDHPERSLPEEKEKLPVRPAPPEAKKETKKKPKKESKKEEKVEEPKEEQ